MKKRYMLLIIVMIIGVSNVKAITEFPNSINANSGGWVRRGSQQLAAKTYSGGGASGKAFCSSMRNTEPYGATCNKMKWSDKATDKQNEKIAVGVGELINYLRDSSGSINWTKYFYGEIAINDFLYTYKFGAPANNVVGFINSYNIGISRPYRNIIFDNYHKYDNLVVKLSSISVNGTKLSNENTPYNISTSNTYEAKITLSCYEKDVDRNKVEYTGTTTQIDCDRASYSISVNGQKIENLKKEVSDKDVIITADITDAVSTKINEQITLNVEASNQRKHYAAQRYRCGYYQTMVPNLLKEVYSAKKTDSKKGKIIIQNKNEQNNKCTDLISNSPVQNAILYKGNFSNEEYGNKLLDISNPSCDSFDNTPGTMDCGNAKSEKIWVEDITVNGNSYKALCKSTFKFNNLVKDNKFAQVGSLLFMPNDGDYRVGEASITYDCNIPELYNNNEIVQKSFDISDLIPKLKVSIPNKSVTINGVANDDAFNSKSIAFKSQQDLSSETINKCTLSGNNITCNSYSNAEIENGDNSKTGFGWSFAFFVDYNYKKSDNGYIMTKDNLSLCDDSRCKDVYGYGFLATEQTDDGNASFEMVYDDTIFAGEEKNKGICDYKVVSESVKNEVQYRTINYDNPFNKINGEARNTGSNWCSSDDIVDDENVIVEDTKVVNNIKQDCPLAVGDLDDDNKWTDNDVLLIQKLIAEIIHIDDKTKADVNGDGVVDITDATQLQKYIKYYKNYQLGDVNLDGVLSEDDVLLIQKYIAKQVDLNLIQQRLLDFDNNCHVELPYIITDATKLQLYIKRINSDISPEQDFTDNSEDNYSSSDDEIKPRDYSMCSANNSTVTKYITNRPNSNGKLNNKSVEPLYHFELTADNIKEIRSYNKENSYNDFNLKNTGLKTDKEYISNFIQEIYNNNKYIKTFAGQCKDYVANEEYCPITEIVSKELIG